MVTKPIRNRGWNKRLIYLVDEELSKPFAWATSNCGDLMAASVLACYGPHHPAMIELTSGLEEGDVIKRVKSAGGLDAILSKYFESIPRLMAQDGDLATVGVDPMVRAGCVVLDGLIIGKGEDRTWRIPLQNAAVVYRV